MATPTHVEFNLVPFEDNSWSGEKVFVVHDDGSRVQIAKRWRVAGIVRFVGDGPGALIETHWRPGAPAPYAALPARLRLV